MILKNCRAYINKKFINCCIEIDDGRIKKIAKVIDGEGIDLKNNVVVPGCIDSHVHLRWKSKKEGFKSGSEAAINGGFCFVIDMPNDNPPITSKERFYKKLEDTKKCKVNILLNYGITDENYKDYLKEAKGYKIFMVKSVGDLHIKDYNNLKYILNEKKLFCIHAEHKDIIEENKKKIPLKTWLDHCRIREKRAEVEAVKEILKYKKEKVYFCHISTKESLEIIKDDYIEVTPHHLYLNKEMAEELKGLGKFNPPLRDKEDNIALIKALNNKVSVIASDHAPHLYEEKLRDVSECPSGIPGLETLIPLTLNLVNKGYISLERAIELISLNPAKIFNINNRIKEGNLANLTILNIKKEIKIDAENFKSKAKFSPFDGWKVRGAPIYTVVNGNLYETTYR
ncbi:dihydroorotase, multifunctional complex type [Methanocaldococcus infernus ME]|uniref:Dihydroorotase n=1 Tax=Methanocaldococcus infernus (strain DSM 11812 / JCM 15783 / ME) TaxID=573063 RepID=D5VT90_METIM|nr:dihydroorotase [Methanocaldococcus infernus]ADG13793.1 dihydroorotase, multifunctional complex type [Methanocaldococcus infernus ME]